VSISETITIDAAPAIGELDALAVAADRAAEAMARIGKGSLGGGADKLAASMSAAADAIERAGQRAAAAMGRMSTAARSATGGIDSLGASADTAAAGEDRLAASADAAAAALDKQAVAGGRAGKAGAEAAASGGKFWKGLGTVMLGTGVAAAFGIDKAMKFQSQMLLLNTQAGVSMPKVKQMSQGVLEISTQTGQKLSDVAESAYHVASNMESIGGTPVQMLKAVKIAAEGAAVGHSNLVDTTTALTSVIASGIPGAKDYSKAMGALNSTVGSGEMNMQQLAEALGTGVVPVVKGYGLTLKDVGAGLATYGDLNIRGAKAGTELRMAVQSLAVQSPTATKELAKLGLTSGELGKNMQAHGLLSTLDLLDSKFKANGITAKNEGSVITELFGKKAGAGLALLLENMERFRSKFPAITKDANNFNQAWQKTQASPQQKWKELTAGFQAAEVNFGTALLPAFTKAAGFADKILTDLNGSKGAWKDIALGAGGLAALFAGNKLASGIKEAFQTAQAGLRFTGKIAEVLHIPGLDKLANIGSGASAGMQRAGDTMVDAAAAMQRAADTMVGADGGKPGGKPGVPAGGSPSGLLSAANWAGLGVAIGAAIRSIGDSIAPKGSQSGKYSQALQQASGRPGPAQQLHPEILGGFEGWLTSHIGQQVGGAIDNALHFVGVGGRSAPAAPRQPAVGAGFTNSIAQAMGKPVKMAPPDISALTTAKGKAAADAKALALSVQQALAKPAKAAKPDISAYRAAIGPARTDGAQISAGLAAGIEAGKGAVVAAAADVANAAAAAMAKAAQTHSPSRKTMKTGKDIAAGLVLGLEGGQSAVDAAATALGKNAAKAADIASIDATVKKLLAEVPKGDTGLTAMLKADQGKLTQLANQRAKLETEITDAGQITTNAISGASIMNAATATAYDPGTQQSAAGLVGGMQAQAGNLKMFAQQVAQLKKMGLNATSLDQIIQAGPDQGLAIAQGLTSGGRGNIGQINQLEKQIQGSAGKLGDVGGPAMYQAGADAGKAAAAGLRSQLGAVEAAMRQMAQGMVNAVRHGGHGGGGGGGGTTVIINVSGHVMTEHDLVTLVRDHALTNANNNWKGGWQLQGRGV
jgi:TP901 family phage tail tape measure protein